MYIIDHKQMAKDKINQILNGKSAFAESADLVNLIKKEIELKNLKVYEDKTEFGYWFIPLQEDIN